MTTATMIAMHYHIDSTKLALEAGGRCEYLVDATTGRKCNRSIFCENTIFVFRDGSMLRLFGGFALTAGRKGVWRKYRRLDFACLRNPENAPKTGLYLDTIETKCRHPINQ